MEKETLVIRDKKRNNEVTITSDHTYFNTIKRGLMPDDYREEMSRISNISEEEIEETINDYYQSILVPICENFYSPPVLLIPLEIMID